MPIIAMLDRDPVAVCDWEAWMNEFALRPSSTRDEKTVLVNNLPCMIEGNMKNKRQAKSIAIQVVSKTGIVIMGLDSQKTLTQMINDCKKLVS